MATQPTPGDVPMPVSCCHVLSAVGTWEQRSRKRSRATKLPAVRMREPATRHRLEPMVMVPSGLKQKRWRGSVVSQNAASMLEPAGKGRRAVRKGAARDGKGQPHTGRKRLGLKAPPCCVVQADNGRGSREKRLVCAATSRAIRGLARVRLHRGEANGVEASEVEAEAEILGFAEVVQKPQVWERHCRCKACEGNDNSCSHAWSE